MILSGSAVHLKGFGIWLASATKRLMAAWRSTTDRKTPRFNRRLDNLAKKPSTALIEPYMRMPCAIEELIHLSAEQENCPVRATPEVDRRRSWCAFLPHDLANDRSKIANVS